MRSPETYIVWMPDYVSLFSCKMGTCRHTCCEGWPIAFSLEDYFRLINEECSPLLREKMDKGIKMALRPTPDRYAEITPDYEGRCPMCLPDGRCAIHAELGEFALADVCRLYPRGIRSEEDGYEISCANSCEAVLEQFINRKEPLSFNLCEIRTVLPTNRKQNILFNTYGHEREIRLSLIRTMQDRSMSLPERLVVLKKRLSTMEIAMRAGENTLMEWIGSGEREKQEEPFLTEVAPKHLTDGLKSVEDLVRVLDEKSFSIRSYGEEALAFFGAGENIDERYMTGKKQLDTLLPDWKHFFEHMLVNHMFFSGFPFGNRPEELKNAYMAICTVYTLLRFLAIGCSGQCSCAEDLTDMFAAAFRLIDHTAFDLYVSHLLAEHGWTTDTILREWILL